MLIGINRLGSNYIDTYITYFIIFVKMLIKISQAILERTLPTLNAHQCLICYTS
jgi:hypothetical protein